MLLYYRLHRFNDVINLPRYALKGRQPVYLSIDHTSEKQEVPLWATTCTYP